MKNKHKDIQLEHYRKIASKYDAMHLDRSDEHYKSLAYIQSFIQMLDIESILDVGCGTGRGTDYLIQNCPAVGVYGCDISIDMLSVANRKNLSSTVRLCYCDANFLPFKTNSVDAVCEFAMLHHVKDPIIIISEMLRVAKKAIFISDCNRFGQGVVLKRLMKLFIYKIGFWKFFDWIRTGGKYYMISKGDGLFYSYSVFDSLPFLRKYLKTIIVIPTLGSRDSWRFPLLTASHLLLCGIKSSQ